MNNMKSTFLFLLTTTMMTCTAYGQSSNHKENKLPDWAFGGFERPKNVNPVISPIENTKFYCPLTKDSIAWESNDTFNPAATLYNGEIVVLYRAEDKSGVGIGHRTSRLGYATSTDGTHFQREKTPVFYPDNDSQKELEWPGGCEDPRIAVTDDGLYVVMYTQWNRHVPRLAVATSRNLKDWTKHGPAFAKAFDGKFFNLGCKSGSILTEVVKGKQVIKKVNGKYFMYWGEEHVFAATSDDLIHWTPIVNIDGSLKKLFSPRDGYFDSHLTECGPPAIYTPKGIVLLYNGKNHSGRGDKRYTANVYAAGQALFDANDPTRFITRLDEPFFRPMDSFEKSGQYVDGTVFIEGMVYFKNKWYLYYGCADSKVGVAVYDPKRPAKADPLPTDARPRQTSSAKAIKKKISNKFFEELYANTYYSLIDRIDSDGYMPESLTGAYQGMFPRTTGALALLLIETGDYDRAEANINYVLNAITAHGMERIPRVIGKEKGKPVILDDQHQIDGQAHVILAWARLAHARGITDFEERTWPVVRDLMKRTCDRTFFQYGGWSIEPELIKNIALEHSKESRMWDVWDLLTQCFVGAALSDMILIADRHGERALASDWRRRIQLLKEGVGNNLTTNHYGKKTYAEMRIPNGDGGTIYPGLGWVTLAPIAAGWEPIAHEVLQNTVDVMNKKLLKRSNGVTWMPTDGYPDGRFSNEIIGKGIGWELDYARSEANYDRIEEILQLLATVNAGHPIYMEGAWLEGNGFRLSDILSDNDLEKMKTSVWKVKDAGNGEQSAWWCWAMARLRKTLDLPTLPKRIDND